MRCGEFARARAWFQLVSTLSTNPQARLNSLECTSGHPSLTRHPQSRGADEMISSLPVRKIHPVKCALRILPDGFFLQADLRSFHLHPETADVVLSLGVLMYIPDYSAALEDLLRALKPAGTMLL